MINVKLIAYSIARQVAYDKHALSVYSASRGSYLSSHVTNALETLYCTIYNTILILSIFSLYRDKAASTCSNLRLQRSRRHLYLRDSNLDHIFILWSFCLANCSYLLIVVTIYSLLAHIQLCLSYISFSRKASL